MRKTRYRYYICFGFQLEDGKQGIGTAFTTTEAPIGENDIKPINESLTRKLKATKAELYSFSLVRKEEIICADD